MTGSSTMLSCFLERKSPAERFPFNFHWKVALELLLRTVKLISERRTVSDIIFERANIFILEKRWYREKLPSSFYDEGSFLFAKKIQEFK